VEEFQACLEIQKRVWGGEDIEAVPLPIFVVMAKTGGQVLGAFMGQRMVGFTLALPAFREGKPFLHSHMTAVVPEFQNRGIGRQLKLTQRQDALERGIDLVEWTFDPLELRNAYFNLMQLGAIVRRFLPNCYGVTTSPLHAGLPTDRLLAEWWLRSERVEARLRPPSGWARYGGQARHGWITPGSGQAPTRSYEVVGIAVPANISELKKSSRSRAEELQTQVREQFQQWLGRGYVVTGIEFTPESGCYLLEPYASAQGHSA
jgi:predicted GNAT superfamily acetyltransferase